jgi:cytochrome P450
VNSPPPALSPTDPGWRFDPGHPGLIVDPYPAYHRLRASEPVHWAAGGYWVATRYADVRHVLAEPSFGQGEFIRNIAMFYGPGFDVLSHSAYRWLSEVFVMQDPPHHTRLRKLVAHALTPKRIADMAPRIEQIVDELLDEATPAGRMDVIADFAYRLPTLVMFDMLGVDEADRTRARMAELTKAIAESFIVFETRALSTAELERADRQMDFLYDWFGALFEARRREPRNDLTSALARPAEDGDQLSRRELLTVIIGMFGAGFETTAHMIGNGLLSLHRHPEQWRALVADPSLAAGVVEEVLRYESSLQATYRTALADARVGDQAVAAGQRVLCILGAANRDPSVFEDPDRFDIRRKDVRVMSFGGGIHHCIGQGLARLEGRIAFRRLAERLPGLEVDAAAPRWRPGFLFRGLEALPARWQTA